MQYWNTIATHESDQLIQQLPSVLLDEYGDVSGLIAGDLKGIESFICDCEVETNSLAEYASIDKLTAKLSVSKLLLSQHEDTIVTSDQMLPIEVVRNLDGSELGRRPSGQIICLNTICFNSVLNNEKLIEIIEYPILLALETESEEVVAVEVKNKILYNSEGLILGIVPAKLAKANEYQVFEGFYEDSLTALASNLLNQNISIDSEGPFMEVFDKSGNSISLFAQQDN